MKKLVLGLVFICILVVMTFVSMYCIDRYYESKINGRYCDSVGDSLRVEKNQGIMLQEMSLERKDNIQIYGSSELGTGIIPSNPAHFFQDKKDGFQINFIGRGYCQSLVHAMNIEALNKNLKDKKVVILISPQWFNKNGLTPAALNMNFSELQFYSIMFNKRITKDMKIYIAKRLDYLLSETADFKNERIFASLYSSDNIFSKALLGTLIPYYKFRCYTLSIKDKINTLKVLNQYKNQKQIISPKSTQINWKQELENEEVIAKKDTNNNIYGIQNQYYEKYIKSVYKTLKNSSKGESFLQSPEYDDFKFLLDVCKNNDIDPLFIIVPINGPWYDYTGFEEGNREGYYKKITEMIASYKFKYEDLSKYEYEKYFLKDVMHLGWKGWLYVDKAIDRYYHEN